MLAYLIDEQAPLYEREAREVALVAPARRPGGVGPGGLRGRAATRARALDPGAPPPPRGMPARGLGMIRNMAPTTTVACTSTPAVRSPSSAPDAASMLLTCLRS